MLQIIKLKTEFNSVFRNLWMKFLCLSNLKRACLEMGSLIAKSQVEEDSEYNKLDVKFALNLQNNNEILFHRMEVHLHAICSNCNKKGLQGMLFKCGECENDFKVCEQCASELTHKTHLFTRLFSNTYSGQQKVPPVFGKSSFSLSNKVQRVAPTEILNLVQEIEDEQDIYRYFQENEQQIIEDLNIELAIKFSSEADIVNFSTEIFSTILGGVESEQLPTWLRGDTKLESKKLKSFVWKLLHSAGMHKFSCKYDNSKEPEEIEPELLVSTDIIEDLEIDLLPFNVMKCSSSKLLYNQRCKRSKKSLPNNSILLFISHRWYDKNAPDDENHTDWKAAMLFIEGLILLCINICVFFRSVGMSFDIIAEFSSPPVPDNFLNVNKDGLASTTLLYVILHRAALLGKELEMDLKEWIHVLSSYVFLWIDYSCLPQDEPALQLQREPYDEVRFCNTLSVLGKLQMKMHTIVVSTNVQYLNRTCAQQSL